jgi:hypothetical protein
MRGTMRKISKVVVFYDDGTFEEVLSQNPFLPQYAPVRSPSIFGQYRCFICGEPNGHGNGMPCPKSAGGVAV